MSSFPPDSAITAGHGDGDRQCPLPCASLTLTPARGQIGTVGRVQPNADYRKNLLAMQVEHLRNMLFGIVAGSSTGSVPT